MEKEYFKDYYILESSHWWFTARMKILEDQIRQQVPISKSLSILNIGVATGATTKMLEKFGKVVSVEYDEDCCSFLRNELQMEVTQASMTDLPFNSNTFDLVCAFDVVEHIEEDQLAVSEAFRVLKSNGNFLFCVPAFQFLWSEHDEINQHKRRYTRKKFHDLIKKSGFSISYCSYYNFFFFLPIAFFRIVNNVFNKLKKPSKVQSDFQNFKSEGLINKIMHKIFLSERVFLNNKVNLPFGVSILAHGFKP